jgi:hypothetical protein
VAQDCDAPCISYITTVELQNDWIFSANPSSLTSNDLGPSIDTEFHLKPIENLELVTLLTTEQVLDREPGIDRAFSGIGTYVASLYAQFDLNPMSFRLGKVDPAEFGVATNRLDGIHATDLLGDYDLSERWALEAALSFEAFDLSHTLTASLLTTDRTVFSESLFTNRGRLRLSDGGAGNAKGISSFAAAYDVCKGAAAGECWDEGDFGLRLGFRVQEAGHPTEDQTGEGITPKDEYGYLAAAMANIEMDKTKLRLLGEAAYFQHFDDSPDDALYLTASASLEFEPVTLMATYTHLTEFIAGDKNATAHLADLTLQYAFDEDVSLLGETWTLSAGYSYAKSDERQTAHTFSLLATIELEGGS